VLLLAPYLGGEWVSANLGFGFVFLLAASGAVVLGFYVVRAESRKRAQEVAELEQAARAEGQPEEHS
jgi:hypothetical protein